jgi:hypothetical protein
MAEWLQIHIDFKVEDGRTKATCSMSGDKRLSGPEVTAALSSVCKSLSHLSGIPFDEKRFDENLRLEKPWYARVFG